MRIPVNRRVAVVGTARSGKTVLLTSLINHLREHETGRFSIGTNGEVVLKRVRIESQPADRPSFPYELFRDSLVNNGTWPEKTSDSTSITISMQPSDWKLRSLNLTLFDFPGERVADAEIAAFDSHGAWSDSVLERFRSEQDYRDQLGEFLALVDQNSDNAQALIDWYKLSLARLILNYKPFITPSIFLVDEFGTKAKGTSAEEIARDRRIGLSPYDQLPNGGDFTPLSQAQRVQHPELANDFAKRYKAYRDRIVQPLYEELSYCDRLLVLCDVSELLSAGSGAFNDHVGILEHLFTVLRGQSQISRMVNSVLDVFNFHMKGFEKLAFVATKIDRIAPDDRGVALDLLKQLTKKWARDSEGDVQWFSASGVVSLRPADGAKPQDMMGIPRFDPSGKPLAKDANRAVFSVPKLPAHWPNRWEANQYIFPWVHPEVPHNRQQPPAQIGLDALFSFIAL